MHTSNANAKKVAEPQEGFKMFLRTFDPCITSRPPLWLLVPTEVCNPFIGLPSVQLSIANVQYSQKEVLLGWENSMI